MLKPNLMKIGAHTERIGVVGIWRFVFSLLIMRFHLYNLHITDDESFSYAWIYVEFFFILTGYFTAKHFCTVRVQTNEDITPGAYSIQYTIHKLCPIMIYIVVGVVAEYLIEGYPVLASGSVKSFIYGLRDLPLEVTLLLNGEGIWPHLAPLWYLSAMFITMPLLSYLIQKIPDLLLNIVSWVLPIIYYTHTTDLFRAHKPVRAFVGMCLGCFVFCAAEKLSRLSLPTHKKIVLTIIEIGCFLGWSTMMFAKVI